MTWRDLEEKSTRPETSSPRHWCAPLSALSFLHVSCFFFRNFSRHASRHFRYLFPFYRSCSFFSSCHGQSRFASLHVGTGECAFPFAPVLPLTNENRWKRWEHDAYRLYRREFENRRVIMRAYRIRDRSCAQPWNMTVGLEARGKRSIEDS